MKLKLMLPFALLLWTGMTGMAQSQPENIDPNKRNEFTGQLDVQADSSGKVTIYQDERIQALLDLDKEINSEDPGFTGYRIQIFSGGSADRKKALAVKEEFEEMYPEVRAYVIYRAPDFRVRVGNFRTKLESIYLYKTIQKQYPHCYPVKTRILFSELESIPEDKEDGTNIKTEQE